LRLLEEKQGAKWEGMFLPGGRVPQPSLLRTHPKTEDRIARLQALKANPQEQIVVRSDKARPTSDSIVPHIGRPQVRWHRLGVYY
jgi:heat shock protein HtpX